jgi:hypothetical protein
MVNNMTLKNAGAMAVLAFGLLADPAAASQEGTDMKLENAGFKMRRADTAEKLKQARLLPPRKFVARTAAGKRYYVYSDPDFCKCVLVGDETAMKTYRDMVSKPSGLAPTLVSPSETSPEIEMIRDMDADVSSTITDGHILDVPF